MKRLITVVIISLWLFAGGTALAQTPSPDALQVGVVISLHGQVNTYCVQVPSTATGLEALEATGVDVLAQRGPLGAGICRIQNTGCTPPADTCFCQCQGSQCSYWAYHYQEQGKWVYSGLGASNRKVRQGGVDAWLWSEGTGQTPTGLLPVISFDTICRDPASSTAVPVSNAPTSDPLTLLGYGVFGVVVLGLVGVLIWRRNRASIRTNA